MLIRSSSGRARPLTQSIKFPFDPTQGTKPGLRSSGIWVSLEEMFQ